MPDHLFIGRLSLNTRMRDILAIFERYGRITRIDLKFGTEWAYAFVNYANQRDAEDAIEHENRREVNGQRIVVKWANGQRWRFLGFSSELTISVIIMILVLLYYYCFY
ncbi:serine/arginine-rich splicing factor 6-like [Strongylocentrotus purpuratus]|uniref:RRM domain-containing protein n=1 Tax=Strongylocentrotus purpuratus TaxID=7668 RepID=A0A7M7P7T9_STRPU|nr:serine/arginine-rich splicing factor 6-like [Strongylocentrotus purpuratus]